MRRRRRRKLLLRIVLKLTPERATTTLKTTTVRKQKAKHCENTKVYGTLIMKCPNCFWHDYYKISPICDHQIPEERKRAFFGVTIVEQLLTKKRRRWKPIFIPPLKRRTKKRINFSFLSNRCVSLVFNKVSKTVTRVWFYCERLLVACCNWSFLIRFLLCCVFIIISQSSKNESAARRQ